MTKMLRMLTAALIYFCAATLMAQGIGVGILWAQGKLNQDNWYQLLAMVHGVDTDAIRKEWEMKNVADENPQASFEAVSAARLEKSLMLSLRRQAIAKALEDLRALQSDVKTDRKRFDELVAGFEQRLKQLEDATTDAALIEVQRTLESLDPKQAKEEILMILAEDEVTGGEQGMNDVVAIVRAMPLDSRRNILGEFKSKPESEKLHAILQRLRQGEPEITEIRNTRNELMGS